MSQGVNDQTGTSYTVKRGDRGKLITFANANPVAVTVPQAIDQFGEGFTFEALNRGAGTVTFTPSAGTINGAASLALTTNNYAQITSDGTNWDAGLSGTGPTGATGATGPVGPTGPAATPGGSDKQVQYNNNGVLGGIDNGNAGDVLVSSGAGAVPSFVPYRPRIVQSVSDEANTDSILATQLYTPVDTFEFIEISYEVSTYPTLAGVGTVALTFRWVDLTQDYSFTSATLDLSGYVVVAGSFLARADSNTTIDYETAYASAGSVPYNVRIVAKRVA